MPSIINATTTNGVVTSGDNSGALVLATNNNTTAVTIGTNQTATFAQTLNAPNTFGFKNRIINGAMVVNQRGGTVTSSSSGTYGVDRFTNFANGGGVFTAVQSSTVPTGQGFVNSNLLTVTTADSSIASSDFYSYAQAIEGYNIADLQWGTASAKTVTLSFWVNSSVTGLFAVALINSDGSRCYPATYTITTANTWQQITCTVAGDTGGTWGTTTGQGIVVRYDLGSGSVNNGTANTWNTAGSYAGCRTSSTVNWIATNGATFYITGVQLEVGSTATSFDYRPYTTELQLCQRYFWRSTQNGTNAGLGFAIGTGAATFSRAQIALPVQMRAVPTAVFSSVSVFNSATGVVNITLVDSYSTINLISVDGTASGTTSPSGGSLLVYLDGASAFASASAEL